jgi:serine/threonine protein kinase
MGAVFEASDQRLQRPVAIKVIAAHGSDTAAQERLHRRFQREARAAARLAHRNIVTIYGYGTDAGLGTDFLVMELLRGEDLASQRHEVLRRGTGRGWFIEM